LNAAARAARAALSFIPCSYSAFHSGLYGGGCRSCSCCLSCPSPPATRPETSRGHAELCQIPVQSGNEAKARTRALELGPAWVAETSASRHTAPQRLRPVSFDAFVTASPLPSNLRRRPQSHTGAEATIGVSSPRVAETYNPPCVPSLIG